MRDTKYSEENDNETNTVPAIRVGNLMEETPVILGQK